MEQGAVPCGGTKIDKDMKNFNCYSDLVLCSEPDGFGRIFMH
mgnify:CR=1 FL=1